MAQQFMTRAGLAPGGKADHVDTRKDSARGRAARPAPAAAAPDDGRELLDELADRLAAVEARLDRLEAGSGGKSRRAKPAAGGSGGRGAPESGTKRKPAERKRG